MNSINSTLNYHKQYNKYIYVAACTNMLVNHSIIYMGIINNTDIYSISSIIEIIKTLISNKTYGPQIILNDKNIYKVQSLYLWKIKDNDDTFEDVINYSTSYVNIFSGGSLIGEYIYNTFNIREFHFKDISYKIFLPEISNILQKLFNTETMINVGDLLSSKDNSNIIFNKYCELNINYDGGMTINDINVKPLFSMFSKNKDFNSSNTPELPAINIPTKTRSIRKKRSFDEINYDNSQKKSLYEEYIKARIRLLENKDINSWLDQGYEKEEISKINFKKIAKNEFKTLSENQKISLQKQYNL